MGCLLPQRLFYLPHSKPKLQLIAQPPPPQPSYLPLLVSSGVLLSSITLCFSHKAVQLATGCAFVYLAFVCIVL